MGSLQSTLLGFGILKLITSRPQCLPPTVRRWYQPAPFGPKENVCNGVQPHHFGIVLLISLCTQVIIATTAVATATMPLAGGTDRVTSAQSSAFNDLHNQVLWELFQLWPK
jgi:hypothetical protein